MNDFAATAAFSHLVGLIYDCAVDPQRWPDALDGLRGHLGMQNAALSLHALPSGQALLNVTSGIPSPWRERMGEYAADVIAAWGGPAAARTHPLHRPAVLSQVNPAAARPDTTFRYPREWGFPQGIVDGMALVLARDPTAIGTIGMGRHRDAGPIGAREIARAELLLPHLQRAAAISRLLEAHGAAATAFAAVIDGLTTPVFVVARDRTILHANAAARVLLAAGGPFTARANVLSAVQSPVAQALARAVAHCDRDDLAPGGAGGTTGRAARDVEPLGLAVRSGTGVHARVHALHVLPLQRGAVRTQLVPDAVAAVFVSSPRARPEGAGRAAAALFGLTPAEARVFDRIAAGLTPAETARALGVAPSTVRTHLLRLFAKAGVRRQADVVQLAAALAAPTASPR